MSRQDDKKYYYEDEDFKCSPQHIPWSNPNEESTCHKPAASHKHKHHHHHKHERQSSMEGSKCHSVNRVDEGLEAIKCPPQRVPWSNPNEVRASQKDGEAVAMEEGVPFKEKEEIKETNSSQNMVAEEGIGFESLDTSGGQHMVSPSRRTDAGLGTEAVESEAHHPAVARRTRIPQRTFPGAYREGGPYNEEGHDEDELTIESHAEPPVHPTLSAELVDTAEEERRVQDTVNHALSRERQMFQDQINQVLQRELQQAVVAEAIPEVTSKRDRRWQFAGAFLLLLLIAVGVVLGITLRPDTNKVTEAETPIPRDLIDLLSNVSSDSGDALRNSSTPQNKALGWLANDTNLADYTDQEKIQRYALATLYYSTSGDSWTRRDHWLSNRDVCDGWYQFNGTSIDCTNAGAVSSLSLRNNNLKGTIPAEIGMLSDSLEYLSLGENELTGTIPSEIGHLTQLKTGLELDDNSLTGTIPTTLGSLILLEEMFLRLNKLGGQIPTELAQCQNLKRIDFADNTLMEDIGPIVNMLPQNLTLFDLSGNHFSGTVPTSIGMFTDLDWLDLAVNNLTGIIPTELGLLSKLEIVYLSFNRLTGTIPTELGLLSNLELLDPNSNEFTGTIPTELGLLSNLEYLDLSLNRLTGTITTELGLLSKLETVYLSYNRFIGTIPSELGLLSKLEVLSLISNQLTGTVPTSLASLTLLKNLLLSDNDFTGSLDALCGIDFEYFAANTCGQDDEINCTCCNACCEPPPSIWCPEL